MLCLYFCKIILLLHLYFFFFFFNDTATTEIYTLSLHDALPIYRRGQARHPARRIDEPVRERGAFAPRDRKSTRLNSSHSQISYAVFCLKKKKKKKKITIYNTKNKHKLYTTTIHLTLLTIYFSFS